MKMRGKSVQKEESMNSMRNLTNPNEETKSSISSYKGRRYKLTRGSSNNSVEREPNLPVLKSALSCMPQRPQSNPQPEYEYPESENYLKSKPIQEKTVEQMNKEEFKNNASYDLLNELLNRSHNFDNDHEEVEISMGDTAELRNVQISGEDNFKISKDFEQSGVHEDIIKKLLDNYLPDNDSDTERDNKKNTRGSQSDEELVQMQSNARPPKVLQHKESDPSVKSEELSDTSEEEDDDFPPNKIANQRVKEATPKPEANIEKSDERKPQVLERDNSPQQPTERKSMHQSVNKTTDEKEDTICKLVQYLDYEESEEDSQLKSSSNFVSNQSNVERRPEKSNDKTQKKDMKPTFKPKHEYEIPSKAESSARTFDFSNQNLTSRGPKPDINQEHTFGQNQDKENRFDTIQVHDLKHFNAPVVHKSNSINPKSAKHSQPKSDIQTMVDDSEAYFNSIINQMKKDLEPKSPLDQNYGIQTTKARDYAGSSLDPNPEKMCKKSKRKKSKRANQTLSDANIDEHRSFLAKHSRTLSVKPALLESNKENITSNVPAKDVWYNVNRILERNGYAKITLSDKTSPEIVCSTVLNILNDYES